jgi:hypothetical protein
MPQKGDCLPCSCPRLARARPSRYAMDRVILASGHPVVICVPVNLSFCKSDPMRISFPRRSGQRFRSNTRALGQRKEEGQKGRQERGGGGGGGGGQGRGRGERGKGGRQRERGRRVGTNPTQQARPLCATRAKGGAGLRRSRWAVPTARTHGRVGKAQHACCPGGGPAVLGPVLGKEQAGGAEGALLVAGAIRVMLSFPRSPVRACGGHRPAAPPQAPLRPSGALSGCVKRRSE